MALMAELRGGLEAIYGRRLKDVCLYGSYARGDPDPESDVDVLIVLDRINHYSAEIERTSHLGADLSLKYGVSISKVFISESKWLHGDAPFLANVREEAISMLKQRTEKLPEGVLRPIRSVKRLLEAGEKEYRKQRSRKPVVG